MKIWIDGYEANVAQRLGSSQVAYQLLVNLEKVDSKNDYTILLPNSPLTDLPKERPGWKYRVLKPDWLWTRFALPLALYTTKDKPDIFFSPTHYIPRFSPFKVKRIVTIFDLSFLYFPQMFEKRDLWQLKNWTKSSILRADHIITISQFSKNDIMEQYKIKNERITVAYPGADIEKFKIQNSKFKIKEIKKRYKIGETYIIYIGTVQPRKNLQRLMEAFARVAKVVRLEGVKAPGSHLDLRSSGTLPGVFGGGLELVIVGKTSGEGRQGWIYKDILEIPKKLRIEDRVKFLGYVPTEDLVLLLSGALVFIQPSLWEGFGIPVLEAMTVGVPVIVSNVSSLPEVAGQAGLLVDPYSVDQIEQAIRVMVTDKKLRQKYSKAGIEQAKKFSWDKMAKTILKVFENLRKG